MNPRPSVLGNLLLSCLLILVAGVAYSGIPGTIASQSFTISVEQPAAVKINTVAFGTSANLVLGLPGGAKDLRLKATVKGGTAPYSFRWTSSYPELLSDRYSATPVFQPLKANNPHPGALKYDLTLSATDAQGHTASAQVTVNVVNIEFGGCGNNSFRYYKMVDGKPKTASCITRDELAQKLKTAPASLTDMSFGALTETVSKTSNVATSSLLEEEAGSGTILENYPDPFKNSTTIRFIVEENISASLEVFDLSGALVKKLFEGDAEGGREYKVNFSAAGLQQGIYIYKLITPPQTYSGKMILMAP